MLYDHPGVEFKRLRKAKNLTQDQLTAILGVCRHTVSRIETESREITPRVAILLEQVFHLNARDWLKMQAEYDLAKARKMYSGEVNSIKERLGNNG